jgi:parvulin-like peptidyl-prolyl isomerase
MMDLLLRSRGLGVLEQLIALELARQAAEAEGVAITPADIHAEYDRSVARISSPVPAATQPVLGKEARETLLSQILARRGLSRDEFNLAMERQAYIRKLAEKRLQITEAMLRTHYETMYDERVQIRHIQLTDYREVAKVQKMLAEGRDFAEVARTHSQNSVTAPEGGLLPPFSRNQDDVPPLLREVAFRLSVGQVSNAVRIDNDYHLIKPIQRFERSQVQFEHVKEIVRLKLIERLLPEAMMNLERDLFNKAQIIITDARLRQQFDEKYRQGRSARGGS